MKMKILYLLSMVYSFNALIAQESQGEVEAAEFIIEKEKTISLPPATRRFNTFNFSPDGSERPSVNFNIIEPEIKISSLLLEGI